MGRERLCRYGARPALALGRFRQLKDGKIAYRTKYANKGKAQHRIMTPLELMARIAALIPPPRHPLVRYHGVLAPKSSWRPLVVPRPPSELAEPTECTAKKDASATPSSSDRARKAQARPPQERPQAPTPPGPKVNATLLAPNVLSIEHWSRLADGTLRAKSPRIDWPTLLRRTFELDVLKCPKCEGRLEIKAVVTEKEAIDTLLSRLQIEPPPKPTRARDPTTLWHTTASE